MWLVGAVVVLVAVAGAALVSLRGGNDDAATARHAVCLPGVVAAAVVRGPYRMVRVDTAAGPVEVVGGRADRPPGSEVEVWFDPADLWPIPDAGTPPTPAFPSPVGGVR